MIKRFIAYYKPHRVLFIIDMLCSVIIALCDLIYPIIAKNIINVYVPARALNAILYAALLLTFIYLLKYALNYYVCYWGHVVGRSHAGTHAAGLVCTFGKVAVFLF